MPLITRTFNEAFSEHRLTAEERYELIWRLAAMRAKKTVEALLPESKARSQRMAGRGR